MLSNLVFALVLVVTSALTMTAVLMLASAFRRKPSAKMQILNSDDAAFLFDGTTLIDTNTRGADLVRTLTKDTDPNSETAAWDALHQLFAVEFPEFVTSQNTAPVARYVSVTDSGLELEVEHLSEATRLTLVDTLAEDSNITLDRLSYRAMQDELSLLRKLTESAPLMLWREDVNGGVTWANASYLHHATDAAESSTLSWPLPSLFPKATAESDVIRHSLPTKGKTQESWFDVNRVDDDGGALAFAFPANQAQEAERTKREFIQTLTKTFATLPIGLAVFDRARRLQIFNPALTDLTGLEPEFLLSRPGIEGFLNRMREKHVLPEPRDYRTWSRRLLEIESSAPQGDFEETWSLPTGQTFRVSASPHPDGALAFLIEDITSEIHMTRNFRAESETSQAVLNQLEQAICVFAPNGQLVLTNTAFSQLWTLEGEESLGAVTLPEALENWQEAGGNPELWSQIGALTVLGSDPNATVSGVMRLTDGECLSVDAQRTTTGALLIAFTQTGSSSKESVLAPPPDSKLSRSGAQVLRASA